MVSYDNPVLDRWNYPFNQNAGVRATSSSFSALNEPDFDDRDGQVLIGFDTDDQVTTGLGAGSYTILSAKVTIGISETSIAYDDTYDVWQTYLDTMDPDFIADSDVGRPLELYGVGYRNGFSNATYLEDSNFSEVDPENQGVRNAFATDFLMQSPDDISNNVLEGFDTVPWAIGINAGISPGATIPSGTDMTFTLDVANPDVHQYLAEALDEGRLRLMISSLHPAIQQGGVFASYYMRENFFSGDQAARLMMEVQLGTPCLGDFDGDGSVGAVDLATLIGNWGSTDPTFDLDGSGDVGASDLAELLGRWGPCP